MKHQQVAWAILEPCGGLQVCESVEEAGPQAPPHTAPSLGTILLSKTITTIYQLNHVAKRKWEVIIMKSGIYSVKVQY